MIFNVAMQGTYLDTILPRADLAENQAAMPEIGERDNMITLHHYSGDFNCVLMQVSEWGWAREISCRPLPCTSARDVAELTRYIFHNKKTAKK